MQFTTANSRLCGFVVTLLTCVFAYTGKAQPCVVLQIAKFLPADGADEFGYSVSVSGTTAIVGARYDDDNGMHSGSAYLFNTATGQLIAKLLPDDGAAFDDFGTSVSVSGATAIVGAIRSTTQGASYVFDAVSGQQISQLIPDDLAPNDFNEFGRSVAIHGTTVVIGAPTDENNGVRAGSAYVFDMTTGQRSAKLIPDDGESHDDFGWSVATNGNVAIIGASFDDDNGDSSGSAYLFDTKTGTQLMKLLPTDGEPGDLFGFTVAIEGGVAIIGAPGATNNGHEYSGAAYLFDTSTGLQLAKLVADDGAAYDRFGSSVAIGGTAAVVGAPYDADKGPPKGSAYIFDASNGLQIAKLLPDNVGAFQNDFGNSVAISESTVIVGASADNSAYHFRLPCFVTVAVDSFLVTRGNHIAGGVEELASSDNADLFIQRATSDTNSRTEFQVKSVSPVANPSFFEVALEGAVFARTQVIQTIELFDYIAGKWEQVDERAASRFTDSTVNVATNGDLSRFVEPGTLCIQARVRYESTNPRQGFSSNTDQFIWNISQ